MKPERGGRRKLIRCWPRTAANGKNQLRGLRSKDWIPNVRPDSLGGDGVRRDVLMQNLLAAGVESCLAEKVLDKGLKLTDLRSVPRHELELGFEPDEIDRLIEA